MKKEKLGSGAKSTLRKASRKAVEDSVLVVKRHLQQARWLGTNNRYQEDTIARLKVDSRHGRAPSHGPLRQYITASAPLHCADGWMLLGRAVDCHARRDQDSARHFAYYAELRAAMSLLAAEGIGVFSGNNFVVDKQQKCQRFGGGTHWVTWRALEYWAELKRASDLLGTSFRISGIALQDWVDQFPAGSSLRPVGSTWLNMWGLDLRIFSEDEEARNEASYRPTTLRQRPTLDVSQCLDFMCSLWSLCEPSALSPFGTLDRQLLRLAVEGIFEGKNGPISGGKQAHFASDVSKMLSLVFADPLTQQEWLNFLTRATEPNDSIVLREARGKDSIASPNQHLQMISRAALLLRTATAASARLLAKGDVSMEDVRFWWSAMGEDRGFWEDGNSPAYLGDMWADVEMAIQGMQAWSAQTEGADRTFLRWRKDRSYEIALLGGCERIALWGLEP